MGRCMAAGWFMPIVAQARPPENIPARLAVARGMFGELTVDGEQATLPCPAAHLHSNPENRPSAKLYLAGAPTLTCFHNSCRGELERLNKELRRKVCEAEAGRGTQLQPYTAAAGRVSSGPSKAQLLAKWSAQGKQVLQQAVELYPREAGDLWECSPYYLPENPAEHFSLFMRTLWQPHEIVWCGETKDSGQDRHAANFKPAAAWAELPAAPGPLTCPFHFRQGSISRCKETTLGRRHWVFESDTLNHHQAASVFWWVKERLRLPLRAVVHGGNKSIHAWFAVPPPEHEQQLLEALAAAGMDRKVLKTPSMPVRAPGWHRQDKGKLMQALLYLDPAACNL